MNIPKSPVPDLSLSLSIILCGAIGWAQSSPVSPLGSLKDAKAHSGLHLTPVRNVVAPSEVASSFVEPLSCDNDDNLYLSSDDVVASIRKLNPKGERTALYQPGANPDVQVGATGYFAVTPDGELYTLAFAKTEISRYVVFKPDGSYSRSIKLNPGFPWIPATIAVFPNGSLLVTGQEYVRDRGQPMLPFTGIFASDGWKPKLGMLGLAFACYSSKPERFTFLTTTDDHRIERKLVEAR